MRTDRRKEEGWGFMMLISQKSAPALTAVLLIGKGGRKKSIPNRYSGL